MLALRWFFTLGCSLLLTAAMGAVEYSWQQPQATVLPKGDLAWAPVPFVFTNGQSPRYIDYDRGDDANSGMTKDQPWKHHPWDTQASGQAKACNGAHTYIFKRGVIYRGQLTVTAATGTDGEPIRLTSDPGWGTGEAVICGSEVVTGWQAGGSAQMPEADKVWRAELPFAPRRVWMRAKDGSPRRLTLARTPNWDEHANPDDVRAGWYEWENPEWWNPANNKMSVGADKCHLGVDTKHLTGDLAQYTGALVWSEYGIMMGSPFASTVEAYDPVKKAVAFQGPWWGDGENIITGNRYFLEDKPQFLDEPGEFYFEKKGEGGTLYLRLPGDVDPRTTTVEAARYSTLLDAGQLNHVHISGLTFQGSNTFWDLTARFFVDKEIDSAGIRLLGSGDDIVVDHCRFQGLTGGVRAVAVNDADCIGSLRIEDNEFTDLDRYAIYVSDSSHWGKIDPPFSTVKRLAILRNHISHVGLRGGRDCHGHTIQVNFAQLVEVAGNIIERVGGSGIFIFGGKGSDEARDVPLSRVLIHHNKVVDSLLITNDWGGIETWQGGPHYLWSNISLNPGGYWNWSFRNTLGKPADDVDWGTARQGFAFYFDGSFKTYLFNNIAAGKNNTVGAMQCNAAAVQDDIGFQNTFFNNTFYRFAAGIRRQAPQAGRDKILGNIFDDMSVWNLLLAEPRGAKDANAYQFADIKGKNYAYGTNANSQNIFHGTPRDFGVFEEEGVRYKTLEDFAAAQQRQQALCATTGINSATEVLADPAIGDYRPARGANTTGQGVSVFVPWGLYATVGEWLFTANKQDPTRVIDEGWYMAPYYTGREDNWKTPRHALTGVNITAADYTASPLEDWTAGALRLNGTTQYLVAPQQVLGQPYEYRVNQVPKTAEGAQLASPEIWQSNMLIEVVLRTSSLDGVIAAKAADTGYLLELVQGKPQLRIRLHGVDRYVACADTGIADDKWHHLIVELDRKQGAHIYLDGKQVAMHLTGTAPADSLANSADFLVGGGPGLKPLAGTFAFLRICRGTLADACSSIDELYAWEFNGPQLRDFAGKTPVNGKRDAGALLGR